MPNLELSEQEIVNLYENMRQTRNILQSIYEDAGTGEKAAILKNRVNSALLSSGGVYNLLRDLTKMQVQVDTASTLLGGLTTLIQDSKAADPESQIESEVVYVKLGENADPEIATLLLTDKESWAMEIGLVRVLKKD